MWDNVTNTFKIERLKDFIKASTGNATHSKTKKSTGRKPNAEVPTKEKKPAEENAKNSKDGRPKGASVPEKSKVQTPNKPVNSKQSSKRQVDSDEEGTSYLSHTYERNSLYL